MMNNNKTSYEYIEGEALEALQGDCQDLINLAAEQYEVVLGFDDQSIQWLAAFIEENRQGLDENLKHVLTVKIGLFLGSAIISKYGGRWVITEDDVLAVLFSDGSMVFPAGKTAKQFENGSVDNIYGLYRNARIVMQLKQENAAQNSKGNKLFWAIMLILLFLGLILDWWFI